MVPINIWRTNWTETLANDWAKEINKQIPNNNLAL